MSFKQFKHHTAIKTAYQVSLSAAIPVYLVGGALRDSMAGFFNGADFDLVVGGRFDYAVELFSRMVNGKTIPWDFNQTRIVFKEKGRYICADFSLMKGADILDDLKQRDFTINSMAVDLRGLCNDEIPEIIDPLGAGNDLKNKIIKACTEKAFDDDPLRILRGIRFSRMFDFSIERKTFAIMGKKASLLKKVAQERIKREFFTVLHLPNAFQSLKEMIELGAVQQFLPELNRLSDVRHGPPHQYSLFGHSLETVKAMSDVLDKNNELTYAYRDIITKYFNAEIEQGVTRRSLLIFAGILHDMGKTVTGRECKGKKTFHGHEKEGAGLNKSIAKQLGLGRHAQKIIEKITKNHMRILQLSQLKEITERAKIRFLLDIEGVALEVLFLAVSDVQATSSDDSYMKTVVKVKKVAVEMLKRILEPACNLETKPLMTGYEVMKILEITEGEEVGGFLRQIRDRERKGLFKTGEDAVKWLKKQKKFK